MILQIYCLICLNQRPYCRQSPPSPLSQGKTFYSEHRFSLSHRKNESLHHVRVSRREHIDVPVQVAFQPAPRFAVGPRIRSNHKRPVKTRRVVGRGLDLRPRLQDWAKRRLPSKAPVTSKPALICQVESEHTDEVHLEVKGAGHDFGLSTGGKGLGRMERIHTQSRSVTPRNDAVRHHARILTAPECPSDRKQSRDSYASVV